MGQRMDQGGDFLQTLAAVERGEASEDEARSVLCFAQLSRQRRYVGLARRLIARRRRDFWTAAGVVAASLFLLLPLQ